MKTRIINSFIRLVQLLILSLFELSIIVKYIHSKSVASISPVEELPNEASMELVGGQEEEDWRVNWN
jgi:hypothetical protein